jgi:hypothetical protein
MSFQVFVTLATTSGIFHTFESLLTYFYLRFFKQMLEQELNNGLYIQNNDASKIMWHKMPEHRSLQLLFPIVLPFTFTRLLALSSPLVLNLFYSCHRAAVTFTASYSSHSMLWLILPIKLHSCTSICTRIHPSVLSTLQLMLFIHSSKCGNLCCEKSVDTRGLCPTGTGGGGGGRLQS